MGLALAAALLVVAVVFQAWDFRLSEVTHRTVPLALLLPQARAGKWTAEDHPVAETDGLKRAVDDILYYNEALYRIYRSGSHELAVYIAYWKPGRLHPRHVAEHTPDWCWTRAGWTLENADGEEAFHLPTGGLTAPAQRRTFRAGAEVQYVCYWHLCGGRLSGYARGSASARSDFFAHFWEDVAQGQHEQYFIRISSNVPFGEFESSELWSELLQALSPLGVRARSSE